MHIHIGENKIIQTEELIGIFNLNSIQNTKEYEKIEERLKKEKTFFEKRKQDKSFLFLEKEGREQGLFSKISSTTLAKREQ